MQNQKQRIKNYVFKREATKMFYVQGKCVIKGNSAFSIETVHNMV